MWQREQAQILPAGKSRPGSALGDAWQHPAQQHSAPPALLNLSFVPAPCHPPHFLSPQQEGGVGSEGASERPHVHILGKKVFWAERGPSRVPRMRSKGWRGRAHEQGPS